MLEPVQHTIAQLFRNVCLGNGSILRTFSHQILNASHSVTFFLTKYLNSTKVSMKFDIFRYFWFFFSSSFFCRFASIFFHFYIFSYAHSCVRYFSSHLIFYLILHYVMIHSVFEAFAHSASMKTFRLLICQKCKQDNDTHRTQEVPILLLLQRDSRDDDIFKMICCDACMCVSVFV